MTPELFIIAGIPTITAAVGYGILQQQVKQHDRALETRASTERVDALHASLDEVKAEVRTTTQEMRGVNEKLAVLLSRQGHP